jgi:probable phosphoglycerate mutase
MSTRVYFVRHGQTQLSLENRFCGSIDPPLNETGKKMAEALGMRLGGEKWSAIYCSPRLRTRETAAPTASRAGITVELMDGLREIAYGEWEGRAEEEVRRSEPERFRAWSEHPAVVSPPRGETAVEIAERATRALDEIVRRNPDGQVLVVSHKATLRVLFCALLGIDLDRFRDRIAQRVAAISIIDWKSGGPLLQVLGDVSHLPPELLARDGT